MSKKKKKIRKNKKKKDKHAVNNMRSSSETIIQEEGTSVTDVFGLTEEDMATKEYPATEDKMSFHTDDGLYYAYMTDFTRPRSPNKVHNACCDLLRRCKRSCSVTIVVVWATIALLCIIPVSMFLISAAGVDKNQSNRSIEPPALS